MDRASGARLDGDLVCDAFASGRVGRPPDEFRFRRAIDTLLPIVSYDGPALPRTKTATVLMGPQSVGTFDIVMTRFGGRKAAMISLDPSSVDFTRLQQARALALSWRTSGSS